MFQTKPEIALDQIAAARAAGVPPGVVLGDAAFGCNGAFRAGVTALDLPYALAIQSNATVWPPGLEPLPPKSSTGRGRPASRLRREADHAPLSVKALALGLSADRWIPCTWREGTNAPLSSRFCALRVRPAGRDWTRATPHPVEWLLIEWPQGEAEPSHYWLATLPAETDLMALVDIAKLRWRIERDYEELKSELGLAHYEGRGWRGFHHRTACKQPPGFPTQCHGRGGGGECLRDLWSIGARGYLGEEGGGGHVRRGARDEETFMPGGQENIPLLLHELMPQATFYTQVVNRGILGHYVATASLATGAYETFNNFAAVSPQNPTVFEYFRKDLNRPPNDAWVIAPSNGFNRIGESDHKSYGNGLGARVILPKRLLGSALSQGDTLLYDHLLRDNYETPLYAADITGDSMQLHELAEVLKLSVSEFAAHAQSLSSPDELSVFIARQLMKQVAPSMLWITLHDIDVAHSGAFSLYIQGIRRSDRLCNALWKAIQSEPEYAGKTSMFILPDFGRDSDTDAGGNGFQHHRTGDALSRTTWLMAMGPGIRQNTVVNRPVESIDLVPTIGSMLGFSARYSQGKPLLEVL